MKKVGFILFFHKNGSCGNVLIFQQMKRSVEKWKNMKFSFISKDL